MRKLYSSLLCGITLFASVFMLAPVTNVQAQTTITTLPNPPYNGTNSAGVNTAVTFVVENTNPFPILLNNVSTWINSADASSTLQLWYSATSLSGLPAIATPTWTMINEVTNFPAPAVNGITPVWTNLGFTIPAGTQYRFAVWYVTDGSRYSGTGVGTVTPVSFNAGGVNLKLGEVQIAGAYVGYAGSNNPRWWTGAITFEPAGPCTNPPVPGTLVSTASNACLGIPFTLSLTGGTGGIGQTYQWQISTDNLNWNNIPGETNATLTTSQTASNYYRVVVTCGVSVNSNSQLVTTAAAVSGTFTINSAVATGGTNFQTFNAAYDYIKCGINGPVVFNVDPASGPYNEQLIMSQVPGASASNTVTFNGNGRTLQFSSSNTNERATIKLNGADHIKFDNLVIEALGTTTTQYGFGVHLTNDADSNAITNSTININTTSTSLNYAGIAMSATATAVGTGATLCDGNVISGNTITGGYYGITLVGSSTSAVRDNIVKNNQVTDFYLYGIYMTGNFATQVDSNIISRPTRTVVSTCNGIYMTGLSTFVTITRNTITNPFGGAPTSTSLFNGIFITGVDALAGLENKVINNKIYNTTGLGESNGINNTSSNNVWIQHNTILMDGAGGTGLTRGFYQLTLAAGIRFENNIVVIDKTGAGAKYALSHNTTTSDIYSNKNDLYISPASTNAFTGFYTAAQATLADWQAASGDDANSVSNNPIFESAVTGNLRPTNASMDNLGDPLGVLIDITALARSATTPDLGAYEFTPGNCTTPPTPGNSEATPSVVCVNQTVSLSLSGHSIGLGQTYQWQSSLTLAGPYTNIGSPVSNPIIPVVASVTGYYRAAITCSGNTTFSVPVLVTVNPALPAGTYTINSTLPTSGTNYANFNAAKAAMNCGIAGPVIFNVASGTGPYNEQLILDDIAGTSATNTVTFNGNGNTIAFSSSDNQERAVIKLRSVSHIIFDSLTIDATGTGTYGFGVQFFNNADSNTINNCTVIGNTTSTSTNFAGIVISNSESSATTTGSSLCDGNTISNNRVIGGYYSITCVGGTTTTTTPVEGNKITGNTLEDFYLYGIYIAGNNNTLIEANNISRPTRSATSTFYGVYVTGLSAGLKISKNRIHDPFAGNPASTSVFGAVYITGSDAPIGSEHIVSNNLVYNINAGGTQYGLYNAGSANVKYYHNTISLEDPTNTGTALTYGFYQTTLAEGIELRNNLITISRAGTGNKFGLYYSTTTTAINSNYNNIYITGTNAYTGYNGANRVTLADWQAATTQDLNSISTNPFYSNPATGNYMPMSPVMDNKGTPVTMVTADILNVSRSLATPDIGAYEFVVPPCTTPPVAGAAAALPSSGICLGTQISLTLDGYTFGAGQTYQWQTATVAAGPYTDLGAARLFPDTLIFASSTLYYRVAVTCGGNTQFSTPVLVSINPAFLAGTYTINSTIPASATNFTSFASAVAALDCGITGSVFFDVAPNTYTEQIRMHAVAGTSPTVRVTFRSANGDPASVILTNDATVAANNYTLKLDSASYITYKDMTIAATNATNGRVIEVARTASFDSIVNCRINAPVSTSTANTSAGIFADPLTGGSHVIKGNTITNGSSGIYWEGTSTANLSYDNILDSNTINGSYYYGIYIGMTGRTIVRKNTVNVAMPRNSTNYGIYSTSSDSAYQYVANIVNLEGLTATTSYGMYFTGCNAALNNPGRIAGNKVLGLTGNTGTLYGIYQTTSTYNNTVNNVVSINTSAASSYGVYLTGGGGVRFHNNSVLNASTGTATTNTASYFAQTSGTAGPAVNIQNNIFSHVGGGRSMYVTNLNFIYSNYNTFYTTGSTLIQWNAGNAYSTLQDWVDTSYWDVNSIVHEPKFLDNTTLRPDITSPEVWAIHGRGTQIEGNDYDFNNNPRPVTVTTGVPDMGAYEFLPTSLPTLLTATPATPAPGITQTFMYGTDTVARITYDATAPVPASINLRRYSGVLPTGLTPGQLSMYFYTDLDVPAQGAYKYKFEQFYIDPWRGFIPSEPQTGLGRTNATNTWVVNSSSTVDPMKNIISDTALTFIDKYTGIVGGSIVVPPSILPIPDSSNRGTRFWVGYGHHQNFTANSQDMILYFSAEQAATVTVRINGTVYSKTYQVPANTVITSDIVPKSGLIDARLLIDGKSDRGISIESDVPIVAYAHIYASTTSEAAMLLPVGTYGYEYTALTTKQNYANNTYSWFYVIADNDSTKVTITPSNPTLTGSPAGVPFDVYLNKGEIYQVLGAIISGDDGYDMTGSKIKSIPNNSGRCFPIAVFSGSSRTNIGCGTSNPSASGDNIIEQNFPYSAWGKRYLVAPTSNSSSASSFHTNIYRVAVKNPATVVTRNGVPLTGLINNFFYQFESNTADEIVGSEPIIVAQIMASSGFCPNTSGGGDPAMIYVSPVEQGIKRVGLYRNTESAITTQYLTLIIDTVGFQTLMIDGSSIFDHTYAHFDPRYRVVVKRWSPAANAQVIVQSDSAFTAITYGLGSVESYGYNAGTLVKNLNALPTIANTLGSSATSDYTCVNAPFRFNIRITSKPTVLTWKLSAITGLVTNTDVVQNNPVPVDSSLVNGRWFYRYTITTDYRFTAPGTFYVPILVTDPNTIEGCNSTQEITLPITVIPAPSADFTTTFSGCLGSPVQFTGSGSTSNGVGINTWSWTFGDNTTGTGQNQAHTYTAAGTYNVKINVLALDGCLGEATKPVVVNPLPSVNVVEDTLVVCGATGATFEVLNPVTGVTYSWFTQATGGTSIATGSSYTVSSVTGTTVLFVEPANTAGCVGARVRVIATLLPNLAVPVVSVDSVGTDRVTFSWTVVPGALSYEVSTNAGGTWSTPSSGTTGLTHTVTGLRPLMDVTLVVKAIGAATCQVSTSLPLTQKTRPDQIYIPNSFTPNGDGLNDILLVYGYTIKNVRFAVFNQWGEKIFESTNQASGWNGTYRGKMQPSGVYMYVCQLTLNDGSTQVKKGSINLVR